MELNKNKLPAFLLLFDLDTPLPPSSAGMLYNMALCPFPRSEPALCMAGRGFNFISY
jgi:hypothetical protein